ncbi:MAG: DUF2523 family protein [Candidatus Sedimenticola sp. 6PFRAG7]
MEDAVKYIGEWLNSGNYGFFSELTAWFLEGLTLSYLALVEWAIPFAWGVAKEIIEDLKISSYINDAWRSFDNDTVKLLTFFQIPEALNNILTAGAAKLVFRFIPGV